ncbi:substrate-binding domain-containing protein [Jatrophihabitans sp.]|uniref:sugar ABC transporter substrate-binding protein n=1 Tax=Jatrophihabitans sp. TaxID=1932789 RepID=UPI0030C66927|nr:hypothetical protein [Jatrophihabitans sp.]
MRSTIGVATAALIAAGMLAACSSSGGGGSTNPTTSSTGTTSATGSTSSSDTVQTAAQSRLAKYLTPPTTIGVTTPLSKKPPTGKRVYVTDCTLAACVAEADSAIAAGKALGWQMTRINVGLTTQTISAGWDRIVRDKPDAVADLTQPLALISKQAAALKADGIPIVSFSTDDTAGGGLTAVIDKDPARTGAIQADKVLADKGAKANAVFAVDPNFPVTGKYYDGFKAEFQSLCSACKVASLNIPSTDVAAGKAPTEIVGYLRSHPDTNYLALGYDAIAGALPPALKAAQLIGKVSVVGEAPNPDQVTEIKDGSVWKGTVMAGIVEGPWKVIDTIARTFVGDPITQDASTITPAFLLTKDNVPAGASGYFAYIADYQAQWKKLWLVS